MRLLEAGQIVNTHGIRGDVRVQCWCDSPEFLLQFDHFYIDERRINAPLRRIHSGMLLVRFEGVDTLDAAIALKNKILCIDRDLTVLPEGRHYVADLLGLPVYDRRTDKILGNLREILSLPAGDVYVVSGESEYLIPAAGGFIESADPETGIIRVNTIKGMLGDDDN